MIHLTWDSAFFHKKIARIDASKDLEILSSQLEQAFLEQYDLIYVFAEKETLLPQDILEQFNGKLVDRKITYTASIDLLKTKALVETKEFNEIEGHLLYELAYLSGNHSRFMLDTSLGIENFKRLYREWIDKSVSHQIAQKIYIYENNGQIGGMVTLSIKDTQANIGLVAVDETLQGQGVGISLIHACAEYCKKNNIQTLDVPTQLDNRQACKFYEKCGFVEKQIQNIYHFWA
ncbi:MULTISPECIES: GNAT family N-acetyltransferase [Emticicia]|uniref:GNAT family N-acetyltransferase n=1 Tax=Emticicia TaxID=312278 RepID=UPI0007D8AD89|nr:MULTISPECIES: GNAT family N-acetyltransferase [Emticicia]